MERHGVPRAGGVPEDGAAVHVEVDAGPVADGAPGATAAASLFMCKDLCYRVTRLLKSALLFLIFSNLNSLNLDTVAIGYMRLRRESRDQGNKSKY